MLADQPGHVWKIWNYDDKAMQGVGWYLYETVEDIQNYLDGPIVREMKNAPVFSNFEVKIIDIREVYTRTTRGPID